MILQRGEGKKSSPRKTSRKRGESKLEVQQEGEEERDDRGKSENKNTTRGQYPITKLVGRVPQEIGIHAYAQS